METYGIKAQIDNEVEEIITAGQLLQILNSDAKEVSTLCQRACLKPKKDGFGNIYFSKGDIDVLKKVKELYEHTRKMQEVKKYMSEVETSAVKQSSEEMGAMPEIKEGNFLARARNRMKLELEQGSIAPVVPTAVSSSVLNFQEVENNIVSRISDVLSEKMDGLDEIVVELIRAKTENETLRQKLNELNKENFGLKNENASFKAVGLGFFVKKSSNDFEF